MKRILITGAGSYIGSHVIKNLQHTEGYEVNELDVKTKEWQKYDFDKIDTIVHVAAIVHKDEKKVDSKLYEEVNCDLAYQIAFIAKEAGVKQFIFLSTMGVYGIDHRKECITKNTPIAPKTEYAKSKAKAERRLLGLAGSDFKLCILRPPMVYGEDSPGNMTKLIHFVENIHIFPKFYNERSFINAKELGEFITECIDQNANGLLFPQHKNYMCTYDFIKEHCDKYNIKIILTPIFNPFIKILLGRNKTISKVFGDLKYER